MLAGDACGAPPRGSRGFAWTDLFSVRPGDQLHGEGVVEIQEGISAPTGVPIPRWKLPVPMGCMAIGFEQSRTLCQKDTCQPPSVNMLTTAGGVGHGGKFNLR